MGAIVLVVGVIGLGAVVGAVVVLVVLRSRRSSAAGPISPGTGAYAPNMGYPPQQPMHPNVQQPYPSPPNQGYPTPPAQPPHAPNPYAQQPPHQGQ